MTPISISKFLYKFFMVIFTIGPPASCSRIGSGYFIHNASKLSSNHPTRHHHTERGLWSISSEHNRHFQPLPSRLLSIDFDLQDGKWRLPKSRKIYDTETFSVPPDTLVNVSNIQYTVQLGTDYIKNNLSNISVSVFNNKNNIYQSSLITKLKYNTNLRNFTIRNISNVNNSNYKPKPDTKIQKTITREMLRTKDLSFKYKNLSETVSDNYVNEIRGLKYDRGTMFSTLIEKQREVPIPKRVMKRREDKNSVFMRHNITVESLNKKKDDTVTPKAQSSLSTNHETPHKEEDDDSLWNISLPDKNPDLNNTGTKIYAQVGGDALLPCRVGHLGDRQVSWIRRRDWYVLTSGETLYTHDERFVVLHESGSQDWTLHIKRSVKGDSGIYECQVSTGTGIISFFVRLEVVTPKAHIPGNGRTHVFRGSPFTILCFIRKSPSPIQHVMWYHNGNYLNYKRERPDVQITTKRPKKTRLKSDNSETLSYEEGDDVTDNDVDDDTVLNDPDRNDVISKLKVDFATEEHSGNYTCTAPNVISDSTLIYVTEGDKTAAVQRIDSGCSQKSSIAFLTIITSYLLRVTR